VSFRELAHELHALLAEERKAIGKLDHERLTWIATQKQRVSDELERARDDTPACRQVIAALQVDARTNAMLAAAAADAVRALLGREVTGYDRRARRVTQASTPLTTY
jgi:flagellar biosynthesis/type III secretory pathway chaperone